MKNWKAKQKPWSPERSCFWGLHRRPCDIFSASSPAFARVLLSIELFIDYLSVITDGGSPPAGLCVKIKMGALSHTVPLHLWIEWGTKLSFLSGTQNSELLLLLVITIVYELEVLNLSPLFTCNLQSQQQQQHTELCANSNNKLLSSDF